MIIREAETKDIEALCALFEALNQIHIDGRPDIFAEGENPYSEKHVKKLLKDRNKRITVAENDGELIGLCSFTLNGNAYQTRKRQIFLDAMFVLPQYRRQGVAKALFESLQSFAQKESYEKIDLAVWSFNREAQRFYEALGFTEQRKILEMEIK
ncbi:MAG: GNAT family N-acetyltransferase [Clostridia bacterium]|nr:GNAT family N-acetyltransferase [Clostridia bacterium]